MSFMERLLVVGTSALSTIKVGFQSTIAKNGIKQAKDSLFYIMLIWIRVIVKQIFQQMMRMIMV